MSNRVEPEIPNITLDQDQVKTSHSSRSNQNDNHLNNAELAPSKGSSGTNTFFTVIIYVALAGASWFFYQENQKLQTIITQSENRILSLENQLSATGEEMGESTIALKTKLEAISEKTEKLWLEMDKLWASAWRKNQSEIKDLRSSSVKQATTNKNTTQKFNELSKAINNVNDKMTSTEFNMNALSDQITAANNIQTKISALNTQLSTLEERSSGRDSQQMEVATNVNQLEMSVNILLERIEKLEKSIENSHSPTQQTPAF